MLTTPAVWYGICKRVLLSAFSRYSYNHRMMEHCKRVSVISKRHVKAAERRDEPVPNLMTAGVVGENEFDTHADTCCAGANWRYMAGTNEVCEVSPFLDSFPAVKEIPIARCCTVWTSPVTGHEYLLVGEQMLWFGTSMDHSLMNPNQMREYGIPVYDNPVGNDRIGIDMEDVFIPFDTTGTIVHFQSRVPTDWEMRHLPVILLTGERWDPATVQLGPGGQSREEREMWTI